MESPLHEIAPAGLEVIETLRYTPMQGFARLDLHLNRCMRTCRALKYPFDRVHVQKMLNRLGLENPTRVRLSVTANGKVNITTADLNDNPTIWHVAIADHNLSSADPWLRHKTTNRKLYDIARARLPDGIDELVFLNEKGEICEGTITNIFIPSGSGFATPDLSCGLLPGVLRQEMLANETAYQTMITPKDLASGFYMGNSLRGLIKAWLV